MRNLTILGGLLLLLLSCGGGTEDPGPPTGPLADRLADLRARHAPDRRTDRVEISLSADSLTGYTTIGSLAATLDSLAEASGLTNAVRFLPDGTLPATGGLIRVSVANIRTTPGHSSELTSQALMGTPVALLDYDHGWYLIRTPDRYLAWLEEGAIATKSPEELRAWYSPGLRTCVPAHVTVYRQPANTGDIVSELVAGNLVRSSGEEMQGYTAVKLPDNREGWVRSPALRPFSYLAEVDGLDPERLLTVARDQVGKPYLWGGTSTKGMDCSGFTKMAYYLNGYVIPRDASQQVLAGTQVPLDAEFSQLSRGDLLFFGTHRDDGSERTSHVGFYLGNGRILHAGADNGYITENSLVEGQPDFAPHRLETLLRARRLLPDGEGVVRIGTAFERLYTRSSSR